jgi:hypothetical protein
VNLGHSVHDAEPATAAYVPGTLQATHSERLSTRCKKRIQMAFWRELQVLDQWTTKGCDWLTSWGRRPSRSARRPCPGRRARRPSGPSPRRSGPRRRLRMRTQVSSHSTRIRRWHRSGEGRSIRFEGTGARVHAHSVSSETQRMRDSKRSERGRSGGLSALTGALGLAVGGGEAAERAQRARAGVVVLARLAVGAAFETKTSEAS